MWYVLNGEIKEVFEDYVKVDKIISEALVQSILQWLRMQGPSPPDIGGQCYDGAFNMCGARSSCKSLAQQKAPLAIYCHCAAHHLNLATFRLSRMPNRILV